MDRFKRLRNERREQGLCTRCGKPLDTKKWVRCECCRKYTKKWSEDNYTAAERRSEMRRKFIAMYGGKCSCPGCLETHEAFLSLDHIDGDGAKDRKKRGTYAIYLDAVERYQPEKYRILCFNCNWAFHTLGKCPHVS